MVSSMDEISYFAQLVTKDCSRDFSIPLFPSIKLHHADKCTNYPKRMETTEESEHDVLGEILSPDELSQIAKNTAKKLKSYFNEKLEEFLTAKAVFETGRQNLEKQLDTVQKAYADQKLDLDECNGKLKLAEQYTNELQAGLEEAKAEIYKLQESVKRLEKENADLRRQRDTASDERDGLQLQVERRDTELERLRTEVNSLGSQLQAAVTAKCQALAQMEEVKSREMTLDFKEKRLEQERMLLTQQIAGLEEELSKRTAELQATRSEASSRSLLLDTRLSQREEELNIAMKTENQLREAQATLQGRCDELAQKLEEQRNHELSMHSSYREEVAAQTRLAELYKSMAEDTNAKAEEYTNAVKELQELVENATEQYGILESKYNQLLQERDEENAEKEQKINELGTELEHANELLKALKQERLDLAVEQLAPTAAVTSRVLKKGLSLTQIYTQLVETTNELSMEREENEKLKAHMEDILREIEEKAPILQQQRENYEAALDNVTTLSNRLDELLSENHRLQEQTDEANRVANIHTRENQTLKTQLSDLARQVCFLLKEVQESRTGNTVHSNDVSMEGDDLTSSQIISKKLVTFRDIEELQENNQKLLTIVKSLSSRQEEIERATSEASCEEMKEKLDKYLEQLADMQASQDRQAKMLEGLMKQRDMYKNMYQQCLTHTASRGPLNSSQEKETEQEEKSEDHKPDENSENSAQSQRDEKNKKEWERKLADSETRLKQITDDFETYKKEKAAHEKMLGEEIDRLRKESESSSTRSCRLKAQLDSANERFHLLQANVASYKEQIKILEEKCNNYNTTIGKHEQSIMMLKDETLSAQAKLSRAEVQLDNLRQERQILKDSESRLLKEREVLHRERQTQALLKADVESIKASLERAQVEGQLRAEQRFDDATRECAALRRRLQEEQDRFRELGSHLERRVTAAEERLAEERTLAERVKAELDEARKTESENLKRIDELSAKLRQAAAHSIAKPITGNDNLNKKIKELEIQLASSQAEIKSLTEQLRSARHQSQQYCDISESSESQLREISAQHNREKEELETALKEARAEINTFENKVRELQEELSRVSSGNQETDYDLREKLSAAEKKLEELDELKGELELVKTDLQNATRAASEADTKYVNEMLMHSTDLQLLSKLKEEAQTVSEKIATLTQERNSAIENLKLEKSNWKGIEQKLKDELEAVQMQVEGLNSQNALLHSQIQEMSDRAAVLQSQHSKFGGSDSPDTSFDTSNRSLGNLEEDSKSHDQLVQLIRLMQKEKALNAARYDVLKAESMTLKSQVEVAERRLKETEALLNSEREKLEIDVVTASKHAELLRKVETLNAITDSNRVLREERDILSTKVTELTVQVNALSEEVVPLREKARDLEGKSENLLQENVSLKGEATRWRQRANILVERANKASPEDWRRLQTERENLSKLLTSERETHAKMNEEFNALKAEKSRLDELVTQLQKQVQAQSEQLAKVSEEARKLRHDLNEAIADSNTKERNLTALKTELADKEAVLSDLRNKEMQIRKIAKKYKTQYEELVKSVQEEKAKAEELRVANANAAEVEMQVAQERETQLTLELRERSDQLTAQVEELSRQATAYQSESENLKKEIDVINRACAEKEERAKLVLKNARTKIVQLTEYKKKCDKELLDLKSRRDSSPNVDESTAELDARLNAMRSQLESRIARLEHEKAEALAEKEALEKKVAQLQRQLAGVSGASATTEPPTANIKPMSARAETPFASIRPMSVVVQSRTAAVLPTTASAPVLVAPQQQQQPQQQVVHTTETSSPTSSHTDYQPASTSSSSQSAPSNLRQLAVQPQLSGSAESTQREDPESAEMLSVQQQQCQQQQQQQQQTVALVSPRVEQQQQQQAVASEQQQSVASSSTQSVSTSQASTGHKRPRTLDSSASGSGVEGADHRQEQIPSPKTKRSRQQEVTPSATQSASEIEYQVPTSSQRDQDEEGEDGCVVVVDCDEGEGGGNHQAQEEEEFENDPYEEMEEEEELPYGVEGEGEGDNNEVEIIMEEDPASVEVPRQAQPAIPTSQQQQQSEAISSAGPSGEPPSSFARSSRGIAPMPRQQQQQHLLLPQQGYEDGGDDCIVPSTPTLFVPRRGDGFGEAVSSPQVPQGRFTFGEPNAPTTASSTPSLTTSSGPAPRTIFGTSAPGVAQVVQEGMDDTRMDLTQLEDGGTGRSVPTTPLQVSPAADMPPSTSSEPSEEQEAPMSMTNLERDPIDVDSNEDATIPNIRIVSTEEQELAQAEIITESENIATMQGVSSEVEKQPEEAGASGSGTGDDDSVDAGVDASEESGIEIIEDDAKEENREAEATPSINTRQRTAAAAAAAASSPAVRGNSARRSTRSPFRTARGARPTPIIWDNNQCNRGQNSGPGMMRGGHLSRGNNEGTAVRGRGGRGRRMRGKYPYSYN